MITVKSVLPPEILAINEITQAFKSINFNEKKDSLEILYNQLLNKTNRTNDEQFVFDFLVFQQEGLSDRQNIMNQSNEKLILELKRTYRDWNGKPIKMWEYMIKSFYLPKHVGDEVVNGWHVSTIWFGLDHNWSEHSRPIIFETMIFQTHENPVHIKELSDYLERYSTLEEAEQGHKKACEAVRYYTSEIICAPNQYDK